MTVFGGEWIGESMRVGSELTLHWRIIQREANLFVYPHIDGMESADNYFSGVLWVGDFAFRLNSDTHNTGASACLIDTDHFVLLGWELTPDGARHDIVFSRPGLAELNARVVWQAWQQRR
jgi:hypothetical protein